MIKQFKNDYRWLSNFHHFETPMKVVCADSDIYFSTNEHFYVSMKTSDIKLKKEIAEHSLKGLKKIGRSIKLRKDWEELKMSVMYNGLLYKFSEHNPKTRQLLIDTGNVKIQEGNYWGDKFWGVCLKTGKGQNNLGKLIMQIRSQTAKQ